MLRINTSENRFFTITSVEDESDPTFEKRKKKKETKPPNVLPELALVRFGSELTPVTCPLKQKPFLLALHGVPQHAKVPNFALDHISVLQRKKKGSVIILHCT